MGCFQPLSFAARLRHRITLVPDVALSMAARGVQIGLLIRLGSLHHRWRDVRHLDRIVGFIYYA